MPSYEALRENDPEQFNQLVDFIASLRADNPHSEPEGDGSGH